MKNSILDKSRQSFFRENSYIIFLNVLQYGKMSFKVPVIAVSANAFDEDMEASRAAGMNGHLAKPIMAEALLKTLGQIIKYK